MKTANDFCKLLYLLSLRLRSVSRRTLQGLVIYLR